MAHLLDGEWTLYLAADTDGQQNFDPFLNGKLTLKIAANGDVDRTVSRHDPGDGSPNELDGKITQVGIGYRVHLFEHLTVGGKKVKRPFKGGLIAPVGDRLIMGGVLLKDQPEKQEKSNDRDKKPAAIAGQEEGTWVATKP